MQPQQGGWAVVLSVKSSSCCYTVALLLLLMLLPLPLPLQLPHATIVTATTATAAALLQLPKPQANLTHTRFNLLFLISSFLSQYKILF